MCGALFFEAVGQRLTGCGMSQCRREILYAHQDQTDRLRQTLESVTDVLSADPRVRGGPDLSISVMSTESYLTRGHFSDARIDGLSRA
jgi:hypothetical protein